MIEIKELPKYEVPEVITYTDEELLEELGMAQTQSAPGGGGGGVVPPPS